MVDFTAIPRGKAIASAESLAEHILDDASRAPAVYALDRAEFGLQILGNTLVGYENWINAVLVERAMAGERQKRPRRNRSPTIEAVA